MTEQEWAEKISEGQARVTALRARLAAGQSEADAAHAEGFLTRNDTNSRLAALFAARKANR